MLPKIVTRGAAAVRRLSGMPPRLVSGSLLGHPIRFVEGSVRDKSDYDDAWFLACALHSEVIFDVGANQGHMAVLAMLCPGVKEVFLLEPNPDALLVASENLIRNQLSARARFICAFVSDRSGDTARLWTLGPGAAGSMYAGHARSAARAGTSIEVPTVTVDELSTGWGVIPDLVKVDVEGAEGLVLAGSRGLAAQGRTRFLVEMHSNPELSMTANASAVLGWCDALGYSAWYLARGTRLKNPDQVRDRGRCHLLLQPAVWSYPAWLAGIPQSADLASVPITGPSDS